MKKILTAMLTIMLFFLFSIPVFADVGPKPSVKITVINPPSEDYVFDLMTYVDHRDVKSHNYNNIDEDMFKALSEYNYNGWMSVLSHDDVVGIGADLTVTTGGKSKSFSYTYQCPDEFRVIILTKSGEIQVSDMYHANDFHTELVYDYSQGKIVAKYVGDITRLFKDFIKTFLITIVIEGIIFLLFRFSIKKNWKVFLSVNAATQMFLYLSLIIVSLIKPDFSETIVIYICEVIIVIAETILYRRLLQGHTLKRRTTYAIIANTISCFAFEIIIFIAFLVFAVFAFFSF